MNKNLNYNSTFEKFQMSVIDEYKSREPNWPCIKNESIGEALELRPGSQELVREIEKISCNPGPLLREWEEQPLLLKVHKIVSFKFYKLQIYLFL